MSLILAALIGASAPTVPFVPQDVTPAAKRSMVKTSSPADGAMLQGPPKTFNVTFVHPMTLKSVTITDTDDKEIAVTAAPETVDAASARIALPVLAPGTYKLSWVGVGGSGREMKGDLSFMVH
jgi:copper resistance protein C